MSSTQGPVRWLPDAALSNAFAALDAEIGQIDARLGKQGPAAAPGRQDNTQTLVFGTVAIVLVMLAVLVVVLLLFGERDPNHQMTVRSYLSLALIFIGLPVGVFVWAKYFYGAKTERVKGRDESLRQVADQMPGLRFGGYGKITGDSVGLVPWLASELDTVVECDLYGVCRGHRLAMLDCTYVVDLTLTTLEGSVGKLGAAVMSHVQHENVRRRQLEAYVFFDPVAALPDLFWGGKKQPLNWYFNRQVKHHGVEPLPGYEGWLISSDPDRCRQAMTPALQQLFAARPDAIVQVFGGYVMVIPQTWDAIRGVDMPTEREQIEGNLNWACDFYEALSSGGGAASTARPAHSASAASAPAAVSVPQATSPAPIASAPLPPPPQAGPAPAKKSLLLPALALGGGVLLLLFGLLLVGVSGYKIAEASGAPEWPTVQGQMLESRVDVDGSWHSAHVLYEYEVDGVKRQGKKLALGGEERKRDPAEIETVVGRYPPGATVTVYYHPQKPELAVLEPRLALKGVAICVTVFSGLMAAVGLFLMYIGVRKIRA